jgi:hypothetical protein
MQSMSIHEAISRDREGIIMGDLEFIKIATGERTRFMSDGTVIKDQVEPIKMEWCDRCQSWKSFEFGRFDYVMGSPELWYCMECK